MVREGHLRDVEHHVQERDPGREGTTPASRKALFLSRGVRHFFRGLMAPGIKGIQT